MCGITGFIDSHHSSSAGDLRAMGNVLNHRGPDSSGQYLDKLESAQIGLAHQRLSILDLSPAGHQPMHSPSRRYVTAFNGEIYNHLVLRDQLEADSSTLIEWKGSSDTETLLACFDAWGIDATLKRTVGMFAIAVWDRQEKLLSLIRDRMGEKPLYYGWCEKSFVFASELKALREYPGFSNVVSRDVLALYMRYSYIPAPYSIYDDIYKLEAGCVLTISLSASSVVPATVPHAPCDGEGWGIKHYWSLQEQVVDGQILPIHDEESALISLEAALKESIQLQSIADVPLGAFLSGGVDSSLIVALMQSQSSLPVKTFTIGFDEEGYSEANYARAVAEHLHTEHTELCVSSQQAREVIPLLPELYDEPFADSSQIPAYLVAQMAREHVTVALSGDGGDELFGGYNRYFWAPGIWRKVSFLPYGLRQKFCRMLINLSANGNGGLQGINRLLPGKLQVTLAGEKLQKLGQRLEGVEDIDDFYHSLVSEWRATEELVIGAKEPVTLLSNRQEWPDLDDPEQRMMYLDAMTYLPDDILCKVDRAAMGVSLETRVPLLDHRVVEMAWKLPIGMKIRDGQGKWALRQILYNYVPSELIERPKAGFAIPLGEWLRGPLRDWAESLLNPTRLLQEGYFQVEPVRKKWAEHLSGRRNWQHSLWSVLMFQAWLERQINDHSGYFKK